MNAQLQATWSSPQGPLGSIALPLAETCQSTRAWGGSATATVIGRPGANGIAPSVAKGRMSGSSW
jgi:hypothetical protein